jgi:hypothetical protein
VTTKSYLFAAVTSGLLLLFVIPLLRDPSLNPTEIVSVGTLTVISVAIAGLIAETFAIMKQNRSQEASLANAKKYFTCFTCSLLFLAIVAPSIRSTVDSAGLLDLSTAVVLLVLSLALGGLMAEGIFTLITRRRVRAQVSGNVAPTSEGAQMQGSTLRRSGNQDAIAHVDSRLNALGLTLETKMQEVKEELMSTIHEFGSMLPPSNAIISNQDTENNSSQIKQKMRLLNQSEPRAKDQVVDVLLGKAKVGGK